MAKKRGRPKKIKAEETIEKTVEETVKKKPENNDRIEPARSTDGAALSMEDREAIYERAAKANAEKEDVFDELLKEETDTTAEQVEEVPETTTEKVEDVVSKETETDTVAEKTETETETDKTEFVPEVKEEVVKTVPLGALHEEREKRKELQREIEELKKSPDKEPEYEDEVTALRREIDEIKKKERERDERSDAEKREQDVTHADKVLKEMGKPGFATIGRAYVGKKLQEMYLKDPVEALAHDNPEGWIKIWNEDYESVQKVFTEQRKADVFSEKKEKKKEAQMVTTTGKKTDEKTQTKKLTPQEEYMKERAERKL
jgi:hypothetical protein